MGFAALPVAAPPAGTSWGKDLKHLDTGLADLTGEAPMTTLEGVVGYLRESIPGADVAPFRDPEAARRGTVGFTIAHGETYLVLEVAMEFLADMEPEHVWAELERRQVLQELIANPRAVVVVTTDGVLVRDR
jgi:hypothetical protein